LINELNRFCAHILLKNGTNYVKYRYNYLYSKEELKSWVEKVKQISIETAVARGYFNNHYEAKPVVKVLEFKQMLGTGTVLSEKEKAVIVNARKYLPYSSTIDIG
jgi:uncharacterized protein YecE (DUF72 family)